jgi:hypothetical protein
MGIPSAKLATWKVEVDVGDNIKPDLEKDEHFIGIRGKVGSISFYLR